MTTKVVRFILLPLEIETGTTYFLWDFLVCFCFSKAVIIQNVIKEFGLHEKLLSSIAKE